jgi:DNA-binding PadR family transcriptional regulator
MRQYPKIDSLIPLPASETYILSVLHEGVRHGYAIKIAVEKRAGKKVFAGTTSLYRILDRMCGNGLLEKFEEFDDSRRRYFRITSRGDEALIKQRDWMKSVVRYLDRLCTESLHMTRPSLQTETKEVLPPSSFYGVTPKQKTLMELTRAFLNQALLLLTPSTALGTTRGGSDDTWTVLAENEDENNDVSLSVQRQHDGNWCVMVVISPPLEGRLALVLGNNTFFSPFDGQGCASVYSVPAALIADDNGPNLIVEVQHFE